MGTHSSWSLNLDSPSQRCRTRHFYSHLKSITAAKQGVPDLERPCESSTQLTVLSPKNLVATTSPHRIVQSRPNQTSKRSKMGHAHFLISLGYRTDSSVEYIIISYDRLTVKKRSMSRIKRCIIQPFSQKTYSPDSGF